MSMSKTKKKIWCLVFCSFGIAVLLFGLFLAGVNWWRAYRIPIEYAVPNLQGHISKKTSPLQTGVVRVPILVYHRISAPPFWSRGGRFLYVRPAVFAEQMKYLQDNNYHVVSYSDFYSALTDGKVLPDRAVVLTFDDGSRDQFKSALPILRQYNFPAIFFVYTRAISWNWGSMNYAMLRELLQSGMEIGAHTVTHRNLTKLDPATVDYELIKSRQELEDNLFVSIDHFAYPFGAYNKSTIEAVNNAGYSSALLAEGDSSHDRANSNFLITRIIMTEDMGHFKQVLDN